LRLDVVVLAGDGIGPEVTREGVRVLERVAQAFGHELRCEERCIGAAALTTEGAPLSEATFARCAAADALLFGAIGDPRFDAGPREQQPGQALLRLRKDFALFANVRPVKVSPSIASDRFAPAVTRGVDLVVVRELNGGLYYGTPARRWTDERGIRHAVNTMPYDETEIARVARYAFELARRRNGKRLVSSVDKANVLETSQLWREVVTEVAAGYPDVRLEHVLVDNAAMALIRRPNELDVLVTENTFGDILTDEASMLTGSIGLLASSSTGERRNRHGGLFGLYEPIHGTAPDIAGTQSANPIGSIGCVAMMLRESFGLEAEAAAVERAVEEALARGLRTPDLRAAGERAVTTSELGSAIADAIRVSTAV